MKYLLFLLSITLLFACRNDDGPDCPTPKESDASCYESWLESIENPVQKDLINPRSVVGPFIYFLDRYEYKMENYIASKFRITENQQPGDYFLYQADDPNITNTLADKKLSAVPIAIDRAVAGQEEVSLQGHTYSVRNPALKGPHNLMNASFAVKTAQLLGVAPDAMQKGLDTFVNVPHRLEWVRDFEGVSFYNDSKATNVEAVFYGLQAMDQTIIWIVGGQDKGNDYSSLMPLVREKVRVIVCMGVDNRKIL